MKPDFVRRKVVDHGEELLLAAGLELGQRHGSRFGDELRPNIQAMSDRSSARSTSEKAMHFYPSGRPLPW